MDDRRIIVLFGDSLLMDTVEASLGDNPELGVMRMHTNVPNIGERLQKLQPHLIIFDWDAPHCHFVLPFLREQAGIPLLGLDVTCSKAIMLCSQNYTVLTADQLSELIQAQTALNGLMMAQ
jgi:hypothetical protein